MAIRGFTAAAERVPPQAWFGVSAVFHYLGPSFAVLLFPAIGPLGVAWLRIASAAAIFTPWIRPWRVMPPPSLSRCVPSRNSLHRAPARSVSSRRSSSSDIGVHARPIGPRARSSRLIRSTKSSDHGLWAFLNGALFVAYISLGHAIARDGASGGVERLGAAMAIAFIVVMPIGLVQALRAFADPLLLLAGIGVGVSSSVIPYVCDQLAMSRLPRATFALMLAILPATATIIGAIVLAQIPSPRDLLGIALVMGGVALHRPPKEALV